MFQDLNGPTWSMPFIMYLASKYHISDTMWLEIYFYRSPYQRVLLKGTIKRIYAAKIACKTTHIHNNGEHYMATSSLNSSHTKKKFEIEHPLKTKR